MSLLELLVALAILSMTLSLTAAALAPRIDAVRFEAEARRVISEVAALRTEALVSGRGLEFNPRYAHNTLAMSSDLDIAGDTIYFSSAGLCSGGTLTLTSSQGRRLEAILTPPHCSVEVQG